MSSTTIVKKTTYRSSGGVTDVNVEYGADIHALTRLEDKIRILHDDLETERELRQRIERDKADLSVQVIQLSERLEEAEGGTESQIQINLKRDTELGKLRKLLEDVHLESEEQAHALRKKHQEIIAEFQDQLDQATKQKVKIEKEKARFQNEVYELMAQIESSSKEKLVVIKHVEKLEYQVHELNIKIEELNRTVVDITSHKQRLSVENIEITKEVQELKISIDSITHIRSQLATQLEDARRRLEDEDRRRSTLESTVHTLEVDLDSVRIQLEEEAEARIDLERQMSKAASDAATWKSKYEAECHAHSDEVEEIRRKLSAKTIEYEEHIESLLVKCTTLEKQRSKLQSEVEVFIIDLEKANANSLAFQKRTEQLEKINIDLKLKIEEVTLLYENTQRDLRVRMADLQKLQHEYEKMREQKDVLIRENKKLGDDLHSNKTQLSEVSRRYQEIEIAVRRLEAEREELSIAYRESEQIRKQEETKAQRLSVELIQIRQDFEKRLVIKDEEIETIRKQTSFEIEQINIRLVEAEAKLKSEVTRIKKKYQVQITELEMSLDVSNKNSIELQKTIKRQSIQITEIQTHYDELQRQLQSTLDQYGVAQRRSQALTAELEEVRINMEQILRTKRIVEDQLTEASVRINEITNINVNISSIKSKLEAEIIAIHSDYEQISKELKLSEERFVKSQTELKHTVSILHEEQERIVKIESIRKSLEVEVRTLTVRIQEVESNALVGGKRIITKLEARIRDIEIELDEEKRRHAETIKGLRKRERQVKELLIQNEDDHKNVTLLNEQVEKLTQRIAVYKRACDEQESMSQTNLTRVRRFQRELETAEERAEAAETNLSFIRSKHRTWVTTSSTPGKQVYVVEERRQESY